MFTAYRRCLPLLLGFDLLLRSQLLAGSRRSELTHGLSPDGCFEIVALQRAKTVFQLTDSKTHKILAEIASTYQAGQDWTNDWAWERSCAARIYWNPDAHLVAIDEYPWNSLGHVVVLALDHTRMHARQLVASEKDLIAQTHKDWLRYRLTVDRERGWNGRNELSMILGGTYESSAPDHPASVNASYEVTGEIAPPRMKLTLEPPPSQL